MGEKKENEKMIKVLINGSLGHSLEDMSRNENKLEMIRTVERWYKKRRDDTKNE